MSIKEKAILLQTKRKILFFNWKFKQIKEDPYFIDFNWNKLISLSYPPPYMIKIKEDKENNSTMPYLSYLQTKTVKRGGKKKKSNRQIKFEKWLKNF